MLPEKEMKNHGARWQADKLKDRKLKNRKKMNSSYPDALKNVHMH